MRVGGHCGLLWGGDGREEREIEVEGGLGGRGVYEGKGIPSWVPLRAGKVEVEVGDIWVLYMKVKRCELWNKWL